MIPRGISDESLSGTGIVNCNHRRRESRRKMREEIDYLTGVTFMFHMAINCKNEGSKERKKQKGVMSCNFF